MSQQFRQQAGELWKTISSPSTLQLYKDTFALTWQILTRLGQTLWLAVCLVLVAADWLGSTAIASGKNVRQWLQDFQVPSADAVTADTGQRLLSASKTTASQAFTQAITKARQQLGLAERPTVLSVLADALASGTTVATPATPSVPGPPASTPPSAPPSTSAATPAANASDSSTPNA